MLNYVTALYNTIELSKFGAIKIYKLLLLLQWDCLRLVTHYLWSAAREPLGPCSFECI